MTDLRRLTGVLVCVFLGFAAPAAADAVVDWNGITRAAIAASAPPRPGPTGLCDFAMVHVGIHDAVQAIQGRFQTYTVMGHESGSLVAAVAKAAHDVLVSRFPTQAPGLDALYAQYLVAHPEANEVHGILAGQHAAAAIINARFGDGCSLTVMPPFTGGTGPGEWHTEPIPGGPMAAPWLANLRPFTLKDPAQFLAHPPPALTSGEYARDYNEVKAIGAATGSTRTPEQTDFAHFFSDVAQMYWNRALGTIANAHLSDIGDSARLFALANLAMADAVVTAWNSKVHYDFWRPITAIHDAHRDGNPKTTRDPAWQPLITTPPYPDYTSGANNLSGATTTMLKLFFKTDRMDFSITSTAALAVNKTRNYKRFSDAADDVVEARIMEGIHFRFADTAGRKQGTKVAKWAFKHSLRPVGDADDDDHGDDDEQDEQ